MADAASLQSRVPESRVRRLARGVNLPFWFWIFQRYHKDFNTRFGDEDFALLRDLGLTCVRVPITLDILLDESQPDLLNQATLAAFDSALDRLLAHNLAVIVDVHDTGGGHRVFSWRLEEQPQFVETFARFWRAFGVHLGRRDPEMVFPSVLNEPLYEKDPAAWEPVQETLLAAMREGAPQHTLIATSAGWANPETFLTLKPASDPNVIYDFHFYEPHVFTHQGATWGEPLWPSLRHVPYPVDEQNIQPALDAVKDEAACDLLRKYAAQGWNAPKVEARFGEIADWARRYGVHLICGEFGVFNRFADPNARAAWIRDVRTAMERNSIGWMMWEYDESFGLVRRENGRPVLDRPIAEALGLRLP